MKKTKVIVLCLFVIALFWLSEWKGDKINAIDFDANDVVSMSLYAARPGFEVFDVTDKEDLQTIIDELNEFKYSGGSWRNYIKNGFYLIHFFRLYLGILQVLYLVHKFLLHGLFQHI